MSILFYSKNGKEAVAALQKIIEEQAPKEQIEVHRTIESLSKRLRQSKYDVVIAILIATSKEEFSEILSIRDFLRDLRVILILPDRKKVTISKGHTLYPRFLSYADGDFSDVAAVLGKMLSSSITRTINSMEMNKESAGIN